MKTLLVDDDPFALRLLGHQLERLGVHDAARCERARDALRRLEVEPGAYGLVFCDLQMPDLDGVEFMRHLAQMRYAGSLVLVSGEDGRTLHFARRLAEAHGIRAVGALGKPVRIEPLREALARHAANASLRLPARRAVDPAAAAGSEFAPREVARAISEGELRLHYQPKVELSGGTLVGVEALARWQHPELGLVYPDRFVAVAENHGLVDALTREVLALALGQARTWLDAGLELRVAVNVSMDNLVALDFPEVVVEIARKAAVAPSTLVLEVTESRLMKDARAALDILARLRLKRVGLSIDDFGTGHSSLAQFRDLPFDELKLDRGFVNGAARDASLRAIVESTLAMAHQLGIRTVAEGVETQDDWNFLRALGCDIAQGYFVARPMPGEALPAWCVDWARLHGRINPLASSVT